MAKLCRVCQKPVADRGGVCDTCRHGILKGPVAPTLRPRVWKVAGLLVGLLSVASSLIAAAIMTHQPFPWSLPAWRIPSTKRPVAYEISMEVEPITRKVFPYSIVPGGAENLDEARRAMIDPGVKTNYAGIDFKKLRQVKLRANLSGYVSYRLDEKIYWTSKMLTLRAGETVFTDGIYLVRGRDMNCFSPRAMLPVNANEPAEKVLDTPVEMPVIAYSFPKLPVEAPELPPAPESLTPAVPIFPPASPATSGKTGGVWFPIIPVIPPIHRHPATGAPPPIEIVVTPEPN